ncbi:MAG: aminotransferase class I/II-fold pyridoxal phosphate-dependent enzyme [Eubacteriales bacterium]
MEYERLYSRKVATIKPSGIRKFFDIVTQMQGAISLGVGEPDFETPYLARRGAIDAIEMGKTFYTSNWGLMELRREIARYMERQFHVKYEPQDEIMVSVGGSEAIDNVIRSFVDVGDEVLIPEPCFVCYAPLVTMAGGTPVPLETRMEDEFRLRPDALEAAITPRTKMLVLPYPNNPTGAVMERQDLEEIARVLRKTDVLVLSDEIYAELTYSGPHTCFADIPGMWERTFVVSGFSKAFAMTGWRLGYVCAPKGLVAPIVKIHQFGIMSAPTMSQFAGITAMQKCMDEVEHMREQYDLRRRYLLGELRSMGLSCFEPQGAFYMFPSIRSTGLSSEEFCERLLQEKKVAVVPGNAFGDCGEGHVRISYAYSMEHLKEAVKRMRAFIKDLKGQ